MDFQDQETLACYVEEKLRQQIEQVETLTRSLDVELRRQARADGGWSLDQILAHLARTNETYVRQLTSIATETDRDQTGDKPWSPTIGGRLLRWSVNTTMSVRTPKIFHPAVFEEDDDPLEAFLRSQRRLLAMLGRMRHLDWSVIRCTSPASRLVRLNPGDVFLVLAEHVDRHMKQLARQREAVERPSP